MSRNVRKPTRRLIEVFTGRILDNQWEKVSSCELRILLSDSADAQVDLGFRWALMPEGMSFHMVTP